MPVARPDFRAAVLRDGTIRLVDWGPWLMRGGPVASLLRRRSRDGIGIVDLAVVRDGDEVPVEIVATFRAGERAEHRSALAAWAALVGYRRIWFDDELQELDPRPGGTASARCTGCGARYEDGGMDFWAFVRHRGAFPTACCLCGSDLPQWTAALRGGATGAPLADGAGTPCGSPRTS